MLRVGGRQGDGAGDGGDRRAAKRAPVGGRSQLPPTAARKPTTERSNPQRPNQPTSQPQQPTTQTNNPQQQQTQNSTVAKVVGAKNAPAVVTVGFIALWYALNVAFNLLNKSIFKYFPFPYTVSTVHVVVGTAYCALVYLMGLKSWSFGRVS